MVTVASSEQGPLEVRDPNDVPIISQSLSAVAEIESENKFDVIIGSDVVCCQSDAVGVAKTISSFLNIGGICVFVVPMPQHRYGTEVIVPALRAIGGFVVSHRPIVNSKYLARFGSPPGYIGKGNDSSTFWAPDFSQFLNIEAESGNLTEIDDKITYDNDDSEYFSWLLILARRIT